MRVPTWGTYLMWGGSIVGAVLLTMELARRGWPFPLTK